MTIVHGWLSLGGERWGIAKRIFELKEQVAECVGAEILPATPDEKSARAIAVAIEPALIGAMRFFPAGSFMLVEL